MATPITMATMITMATVKGTTMLAWDCWKINFERK
jgi:hypothetical protein